MEAKGQKSLASQRSKELEDSVLQRTKDVSHLEEQIGETTSLVETEAQISVR